MAARRRKKRARTSAPAKGSPRAERSAADGRPTRSLARGLAMLFLPPIASALLLTLAFPPAEISWLAYVALAPLLVTAVRARSTRDAFWAAFAAGIVFFGVNLYWVQPVTTPGYVALVPYMALYWAVGAWLVRRIGRAVPAGHGTLAGQACRGSTAGRTRRPRHRPYPCQGARVPMAVVAPAVWVGLELARGWMLSGLPWLLVGHTQYENLVLIQTADAVGAYGATFLCLATSGLAADLLVRSIIMPPTHERPRRISRTVVVAGVLTLAAWAGTVGYGVWRLNQDAAREGPVVASVQTAVPQEIKRQAHRKQILELEERLLRQQFDLTDSALASAGERGLQADLIVWPETMVPGVINEQFLDGDWIDRVDDAEARRRFASLRDRYRGYWSQVHEKARQAGAPILCGAHNQRVDTVARLPGGLFVPQGPRYNTALLISPQTKPHAADHVYSKVHLVPFGEFLPFRSWPWLYKHLLAFTPYSYDYSLTPGDPDQTPFALTFDGRTSRFQVAICYEDAMAYRIREMVRPSASRERERAVRDADGAAGQETRRAGSFEETRRADSKAVDFIVNISNDGWFVKGWFADDGTYELDQHLNLCVFRAVENRVAIVRSVNTGISAIITPTGRIDEIAETDGRRRNVTGYVVGRLTFDDRVAPYTHLGDVFAKACLMATAILVIASVVGNLRKRKETAA